MQGFSFISRRFLHMCCPQFNVGKSSALGKLRKSTGYSVSNCKKALELFPADVAQAEEWLHAQAKQQGWSKWAKIQTRSASQGLIGVFSKGKTGVMVEVNCETDFVARNLEFQQLVENIIFGCMKHVSSASITDDVTKIILDEAQLNGVQYNSSTLGELVSAAICKFNEKTVLKRAICLKVREDINLKSLSHPSITCSNLSGATLGKYGILLAYKYHNMENMANKDDLSLNICQHVIGMNPSSVGCLTEQDILKFSSERNPDERAEMKHVEETNVDTSDTSVDHSDLETEEQDTINNDLKDVDDTRLLFQPYLLDTNVTVGEVVLKSGLEILDFERFECGENLNCHAETMHVKL